MDDRADPVEPARRFVAEQLPSARLADALRRATCGDPGPLDAVASEVLGRTGGPLLEGYRSDAKVPS